MEDVTRRLADYACGSEPGSLPGEVKREAVRSFVNFVGCCYGGCRHEAVETALSAIADTAGPPVAPLIGRGESLDPLNAALINCMSSAVHTFDDTHLKSIIHPGGPVAAALLGVAARRKVQGREFVHALALGIEVSCRIGNMFMVPPAKASLGLFMTGVAGAVGAAVAAGKLLGLSPQRMVYAIGLGATQAAGLREMHGTMASSFVCGNGSRAGLLAAFMAEKGFTTGTRGIEGPMGLAAMFGAPANLDAVTDGLGSQFELMNVTYKPYPCGIAIHPAIDACLEVVRTHRIAPDDIAEVELEVHPVAIRLTGRTSPTNALEAQVSIFHWAAASLLSGKAGLDQASTECVLDPRVASFRERVKVRASDAAAPDAAVASVTTKQGRVLRVEIDHCRGSADRPLSDADLGRKFLEQASIVLARPDAQRALAACYALESLEVDKTMLPATP